MRNARTPALRIALAALLALFAWEAADAASKKKRNVRQDSVVRDYDGTPIIMQGFRADPSLRDVRSPAKRAPSRGKARTRGSSTLIPPTVPSPNDPRQPGMRLPPAPTGVYTPPPVNSFGDRATRCNHSFPLNAGVGNNPMDRDSFVRQCAN